MERKEFKLPPVDPRYRVAINAIKPRESKWIWLEPCHKYHGAVYAYVYEDNSGWHGWREKVDQTNFPITSWLKGIWQQCAKPATEPDR